MLAYFLKYWIGGLILIILVIYGIGWGASLLSESLLKVIAPILVIVFSIWVISMFIKIFKAEYEDYKREKPFNDAMRNLQRQILKDAWKEFKLAWANRRNRR